MSIQTGPEDEIEEEGGELLLETEVDDSAADDDGDISLDEETVISLEGEEANDVEETPVIKHLRTQLREKSRRVRELETATQTAKPKVEIGPEPTLEDCDYDGDLFKQRLEAHFRAKTQIEKDEADAKASAAQAEAAWQATLAKYEQAKAKLAVPGKEEAEEEALSKLSKIQQAIIVKHPQNAAIMIALGKYPKRLAAVSAINDNVDFTYAIGDMARELKVTARRKAPEPEGIARGSAPLSGATAQRDKQRNAILDKMAKGGDVTKLRAQLRQLDAR